MLALRRMYSLSIPIVLILSLALAGCVDRVDGDREPAQPDEPADVDAVTDGSAAFGFDLFSGLAERTPDENVITSPYSAAMLLTMLLNGAAGETRDEIADVLHLSDSEIEDVNRQHQELKAYLQEADHDVELAIANSLWAAEGAAFEDEFLSTMREYLDATVEELDLGSQEAVDRIDAWVDEETRGLIDGIAEDLGLPDPNTILVLLNAVYFQGEWTEAFDSDRTVEQEFAVPDGDQVTVPFMHRIDQFQHADMGEFQALRMTYGLTDRFAMEFFLPSEESSIEELRQRLDFDLWRSSISELDDTRLGVYLPRFEIEYSTEGNMNEVLQELGMELAFDGAADFSNISQAGPWVDDVIQKTYIRVDEQGTEAAAVTGADMPVSAPPAFRADRPFLFTISEVETSTILFLGQVTDPS